MIDEGLGRRIATLVAGLVVWGGHLGAVYALESVVCAAGGARAAQEVLPIAVTAITAAALLMVGTLLWSALARSRATAAGDEADRAEAFWRNGMIGTSTLALVAIVWTASPVLILPPCSLPAMPR